MNTYYVYIITNQNNTVLYIGVTNDLKRRIYEHKNTIFKGFSSKYNIEKLVYYEIHNNINEAIVREKRLKEWKREWKDRVINELNPTWDELYEKI